MSWPGARPVWTPTRPPRRRPPAARPKGIEAIIRKVASRCSVTRDELLSDRRFPRLVEARAIACRELRDLRFSTTEIGRYLGIHHTSVIHLLRKTKQGPVELPEVLVGETDWWAI